MKFFPNKMTVKKKEKKNRNANCDRTEVNIKQNKQSIKSGKTSNFILKHKFILSY